MTVYFSMPFFFNLARVVWHLAKKTTFFCHTSGLFPDNLRQEDEEGDGEKIFREFLENMKSEKKLSSSKVFPSSLIDCERKKCDTFFSARDKNDRWQCPGSYQLPALDPDKKLDRFDCFSNFSSST